MWSRRYGDGYLRCEGLDATATDTWNVKVSTLRRRIPEMWRSRYYGDGYLRCEGLGATATDIWDVKVSVLRRRIPEMWRSRRYGDGYLRCEGFGATATHTWNPAHFYFIVYLCRCYCECHRCCDDEASWIVSLRAVIKLSRTLEFVTNAQRLFGSRSYEIRVTKMWNDTRQHKWHQTFIWNKILTSLKS